MVNRRKKQRRQFPRVEADWPAAVISAASTLHGRVKNISRGGALIYLPEELQEQEHVRIAVEIPEYDDVIYAEGKVVRAYPVISGYERSTYASGIQFTSVSQEDLKYFSGNLAAEWQEGYEDNWNLGQPVSDLSNNDGWSDTPQPRSKLIKNSVLLFVIIITCSALFYSLGQKKGEESRGKYLAALEGNIKYLEENYMKLDSLSSSIKDDIYSLKANVDGALKEISANITKNEKQIQSLKQPVVTRFNVEQSPGVDEFQVIKPLKKKLKRTSSQVYHIVKDGENLYRIGLRYGVSLDFLREINNLTSTSSIYTNQKLLVSKRPSGDP